MSANECFINWANKIVYYNIILKATDHHSDDTKLHETLTHQMSEGLVNKIKTLPADERNRICDIKNINIWMQEVETVDRTWKTEVKVTADMMNELLNKCSHEEACINTRNNEFKRTHNTEQHMHGENCDESRYHPYHSRNNDRSDHKHNRNKACNLDQD